MVHAKRDSKGKGEVQEKSDRRYSALRMSLSGFGVKIIEWLGELHKGVRHTCPGPSKGRGEARYFAPKGTQGKGGVGRKSKAEELSAEDSLGSDQSARPEVQGAQDGGGKSRIL